ncbi:MAG: hypothetical protein ACLR8Y_04280 [Alistipes indistinctus]
MAQPDFYPYDSMREIKANWRIEIVPQLNGRPFRSQHLDAGDGLAAGAGKPL